MFRVPLISSQNSGYNISNLRSCDFREREPHPGDKAVFDGGSRVLPSAHPAQADEQPLVPTPTSPAGPYWQTVYGVRCKSVVTQQYRGTTSFTCKRSFSSKGLGTRKPISSLHLHFILRTRTWKNYTHTCAHTPIHSLPNNRYRRKA